MSPNGSPELRDIDGEFNESERQRIFSVLAEFRSQSLLPQEDDSVLGDLLATAVERYMDDTLFKNMMNTFILSRVDLDPTHAVHVFSKSVNKQARRYDPHYIDSYYKGSWHEIFERIFGTDGDLADFVNDLLTQVASKTVADRGKLLALFIPLAQQIGRLPEMPTGVEVGGGRGHIGPKIQAIGKVANVGYFPLGVMKADNDDYLEVPTAVTPDIDRTIKSNVLIAQPKQLGSYLVIDKKSLASSTEAEWGRAQFRPKEEIEEKHKIREYEFFDSLRKTHPELIDNIEYVQGDAAEPKFLELLQSSAKGFSADIVYFPLSLYQNSERHRAQMFEFAKAAVGSEGFIVIQDGAFVEADKKVIRFYKRRTLPWRYGFIVIDMKRPNEAQQLMICDSDSVTKIIPGKGVISGDDGRLYRLEELIDEAELPPDLL